jgi:hypothetical protein
MVFEIHANKLGKPYLKKVDRYRVVSEECRGQWMSIGRLSDPGIERIVKLNQENGLIVLIDDEDIYRALVLTE